MEHKQVQKDLARDSHNGCHGRYMAECMVLKLWKLKPVPASAGRSAIQLMAQVCGKNGWANIPWQTSPCSVRSHLDYWLQHITADIPGGSCKHSQFVLVQSNTDSFKSSSALKQIRNLAQVWETPWLWGQASLLKGWERKDKEQIMVQLLQNSQRTHRSILSRP